MYLATIMAAAWSLAATTLALPVLAQDSAQPKTTPAGQGKSGKTRALETGAKILQSKAPLRGFDVYLDGFHPMKEHPEIEVEAHHYCRQVNDDFAQCALFDGNTATANLNGSSTSSRKSCTTLYRRQNASYGIRTMAKSCPANWSHPAFPMLRSTR